MDDEPDRRAGTRWKRVGCREAVVIVSSVIRSWKGQPIGDGTCPENRRAAKVALRVRLPLFPLMDAQSDRLTEPGLNPGEPHGLAGSTPAASAQGVQASWLLATR